MAMNKPYSESCEQNKAPIAQVLQTIFADRQAVLEIGSGTGQHAVYFGSLFPHLHWHTSDLSVYHAGIRAWLAEAMLANVHPPLDLDVTQTPWPTLAVDAVYSANTAHIMGWPQVQAMFAGVAKLLPVAGLFALYGPFNYGGQFTSASNARFEQWLRERDPVSGIRDFEALDALARAHGMTLDADYAMPVNNHFLVWCKDGVR